MYYVSIVTDVPMVARGVRETFPRVCCFSHVRTAWSKDFSCNPGRFRRYPSATSNRVTF